MTVRPNIVVLVPRDWFFDRWTRFEAMERLRLAFEQKFPSETVHLNSCEGTSDDPVMVLPEFHVDLEGRHLYDYEELPEDLLHTIGSLAVAVLTDHEIAAALRSRRRLNKAAEVLAEYARRPKILSEFMSEAANLYGLVVETDLAMLMASDHFSRIARDNPGATQYFSRNVEINPGAWGIPYSHIQSAEKCVENFSALGRNATLRDKSVAIHLFALWENRFRNEISKNGDPISSDYFGELRLLRNCFAHGGSWPEKGVKAIQPVPSAVGPLLNLDQIFDLFADELNRIARVHFDVSTSFSMRSTAGGVTVALGPKWVSDHRMDS